MCISSLNASIPVLLLAWGIVLILLVRIIIVLDIRSKLCRTNYPVFKKLPSAEIMNSQFTLWTVKQYTRKYSDSHER